MATVCEWRGDVTHPHHLFLWDGTGQISWCQECYWQFPLFLGSCSCSKLGKFTRQNMGRNQVSAAEQNHNSVSCLGIFWCFWGHQNIEWSVAGSWLLFSLLALQLISISPEVWHGVNHTRQALFSAVCGSGESACVADRAARAVCASNGVLQAEGEIGSLSTSYKDICDWLTPDTAPGIPTCHLKSSCTCHWYLQSRPCFPEEEGIRSGCFWGSIYCTLLGLTA